MSLIVRLLINAVALWIAIRFVPGITFQGDWIRLLSVAIMFGLVNAIVRPIVTIVTFPLLILTLGLFTFVINALMLLLTSGLSAALGLSFHVAGFWPALYGALVMTVVSLLLSMIIPGRQR